MRLTTLIAIPVTLLLSWMLPQAQRGGPPRRLENPETIHLPGGSEVRFEKFHAPALGKEISYSIYLPPSYQRRPERRYPVIYFLHGMFNDHTSWAVERYGNVPERLEALILKGQIPEFLMVHPDGERSFYTDYLDGSLRYEAYISRDVVKEIEKRYRVLGERRYRALGGTSMGAYGALKIALKHPRQYASVLAVSPIVLLGEDPSRFIMGNQSRMAQFFADIFRPIFGMPFDRNHWRANSLEVLAGEADVGDLRVYFSYGTADRYADDFPMELGVRTLHQILEKRGIPHTFRVIEGGPHGWQLVVDHLEEELQFLTETFREP